MSKNFLTTRLENVKHIALIAHDEKKDDLLKWVKKHKQILENHILYATGTTGTLIKNTTGLNITTYNSGPLGGDQQIGSRIVEGLINCVIFFSDPLESQPHDPDVRALLRIANVYDIPFANNMSTADFIISSELFNKVYEYQVEDYRSTIYKRIETIESFLEE